MDETIHRQTQTRIARCLATAYYAGAMRKDSMLNELPADVGRMVMNVIAGAMLHEWMTPAEKLIQECNLNHAADE